MLKDLYIVDDNADHQFLMFKIFKQFDKPYVLKFFEDGNVLYRHLDFLAQQQDFDRLPGLIILDLNMPRMNGMQLLKLIKQPSVNANEHFMQIPVVVMSSDIREEKIRQCYQAGADAYIVKPIGLEEIKATLQGICNFWLDHNANFNMHNQP